MKSKKTVLLILCMIVTLCFAVALTACNKTPANDHKTDYAEGDTIIDDKDMNFLYYDEAEGFGYAYVGKQYQIRYLMKDGSNSYVTLKGEDNDSLVITGHKGAIKQLSLEEIESTVKINQSGISIIGIGKNAFKGSQTLSQVDLTKACNSLDFEIEEGAFEGCSVLTSVKLPTQVYTTSGNIIGDRAFASCSSLKTVTFASSFNQIGSYAFAGCQDLESITLPDSVTVIREGTFQMCDSLTNFSGANNLRSIQAGAFQGTSLDEFKFDNFDNLVYIGSNSFESTKLQKVNIPSTLTYIGTGAFKNIEPLEEVTIPFLGYSRAENYNWTFAGVYGLDSMKRAEDEAVRSIVVTVAQNATIPVGAFSGSADVKSLTITSLLADGNYNVYDDEGISYTRQSVVASSVIPEYAFYGCESLQSVSMPDGITEIKSSAFENCINLSDYTLPTTLEMLGERAFYNCRTLSSISLPASLTAIGGEAFYNCSNLPSLTLPSSLLAIGDKAFYGCRKFTQITLPASLEAIGLGIFGDCSNLEKLTIARYNWLSNPELTGVERYMVAPLAELFTKTSDVMIEAASEEYKPMYRCASGYYIPNTLSEVTVERVNSLMSGAFAGWESLETVKLSWLAEEIEDADGHFTAGAIGYNAFYGCEYMTSLTIVNGSSIRSIGDSAFYGCRNLTSSPLTEKVESIGDQALYGCSALTSVVFPATVTYYGSSILGDCYRLSSVEIKNYNYVVANEDFTTSFGTAKTAKLFATSSEYLRDNIYMDISETPLYRIGTGYYLPRSLQTFTLRGVNQLEESAFSGFTSLTSVTLELVDKAMEVNSYNMPYTIGNAAFGGCTNLATLTTTNFDKVVSIGNSAFYNCYALNELPTMSGLREIGDSAFYGCRKITAFTLPVGVDTIGSSILADCISLQSLTVESYGFFYNGSWRSVSVDKLFSKYSSYMSEINTSEIQIEEDDVKVYSANSYYLPKSLTTVTYNNVIQLENNAFCDWTKLQHIAINFYETEDPIYQDYSIGDYAFYGCSEAEITFANLNKINTIGSYAFYNCTNVDIPFKNLNRLYSIDSYAFCKTAITEVTINENATYLGEAAFKDCAELTSVNILSNHIYAIQSYTFSGCSKLATVALSANITSIYPYAFENCNKLENVYYGGSNWNYVNVNSYGNSALSDATILVQNTSKGCVHAEGEWRWLDGEISTELTFGEPEVVTTPTCTTSGENKATCTVCGQEKTYTVKALGHDIPTPTEEKAATCLEDGFIKGVCSRCQLEIEEVIPALGHEAGDWAVVTEPTCAATGSRTKSCTRCNEVLETETIPVVFDIDELGYCKVCGAHLMHMSIDNVTCGICNQPMPYTMTSNGSRYTFELDGDSAEYVSNNKNVTSSDAYLTITASADVIVGFAYSVDSESGYDKLYIRKNDSTCTDDTGRSVPSESSGKIDFQQEFYNVTLHEGDTLTFRYSKDSSTNSGADEARIRMVILSNVHNVKADEPAEPALGE